MELARLRLGAGEGEGGGGGGEGEGARGSEREGREREREEKIKKRILSRGLIDDLKRQHLDTPEEVFDAETSKQSRQVAYERERTRLVLLRSLGLLDMYVSLPILSHLITVLI